MICFDYDRHSFAIRIEFDKLQKLESFRRVVVAYYDAFILAGNEVKPYLFCSFQKSYLIWRWTLELAFIVDNALVASCNHCKHEFNKLTLGRLTIPFVEMLLT